MKPCVAWADKAALPQPLPRGPSRVGRAGTFCHACKDRGTPSPSTRPWGCVDRGDQLGSCLGTSWLWDQQDIIIYECLSGQHKLLSIKPKRSEGLG